jgi:hypothetical protein
MRLNTAKISRMHFMYHQLVSSFPNLFGNADRGIYSPFMRNKFRVSAFPNKFGNEEVFILACSQIYLGRQIGAFIPPLCGINSAYLRSQTSLGTRRYLFSSFPNLFGNAGRGIYSPFMQNKFRVLAFLRSFQRSTFCT